MELYEIDDLEGYLLSKIDSGEKLTEEELKVLCLEFDVEVDNGDIGRWTHSKRSISELKGRYFSTYWEMGLTECQENEFYRQPTEVKSITYDKTITVTEWIPIKESSNA